MLTPSDTWSCPTLGLACVLMSRPISPELVLYPDFWISNIPRYFSFASFQEYVTKRISHPVFYGDLVYKIRRVKDTPNFISSGSKIVKRLRRRQYDPLVIERTIGLVLGPSTALYGPFLKHCTLTNKAVGTIWRALSKPPQRRQGPDLRPLWLLVGTPSAIRPELAFSRAEHSLSYLDVCYIMFIIYALRVSIFITSPLGVAVGLLSI